MVTHYAAYDEIVDFLAGMNPRKLVDFRASDNFQNRLDDLLEKNREAALSADEQKELDHLLLVNHLVSLAKVRAMRLLREPAIA